MSRGLDAMRAAGLAGVAAGLLACGGPAERGTGPPIGPVPAAVDGATLRLPLDAYLGEVDDWLRFADAHRVLVGECLRRFGRDLPPDPHDGGTSVEFGNSRRYGITDPALAAEHGYAPGPEPAREAPRRATAPDAVALDLLVGRGARSVDGQAVPRGGCQGEAERRLAGTTAPPVDPQLPQRLAVESWQRSAQDSRVRAAVVAWSGCMRERGLDYDDPLGPPADPRFRGGPSPEEISTAAADLECKSRSGLVPIWSTVETALQELAIEQHAGELARLRTWQLSRFRTAQEVLAEATAR
jgi:hypothetical protein